MIVSLNISPNISIFGVLYCSVFVYDHAIIVDHRKIVRNNPRTGYHRNKNPSIFSGDVKCKIFSGHYFNKPWTLIQIFNIDFRTLGICKKISKSKLASSMDRWSFFFTFLKPLTHFSGCGMITHKQHIHHRDVSC